MRDTVLGEILYFTFTTKAFATNIPTTLLGSPVVSAYENDSVTQITAGVSLSVDHDSVTGLNLVTVTPIGGNGFEAGKEYSLVVTTGTVDSVSYVGTIVGEFSLEKSAAAVDLANTGDGLGVLKSTLDTNAAAIANIGSASGGALNFEALSDNTGGAIKTITFVGAQTGTYTNTESEDGVYHQIDDTGDAIDIVYQYSIGGSYQAVEFTFKGYLSSGNDTVNIQAYDFVGAGWDTVKTLGGQAGSSNVTEVVSLLGKHTGTGADIGEVLLRFVTTGQTNPTLFVDQLLVAAVNTNQSRGYSGGAVWIDTLSGVAGTVSYVNGVSDNPVNNLADATTIANNLNLRIFHILPGSSITLATTYTGCEFIGIDYSLAFGGQAAPSCFFMGASISGVLTGAGVIIQECIIDTATTLPPCVQRGCFWGETTITFGSAGAYYFNNCRSRVAGTGTVTIDWGAGVGVSSLNMRDYRGGVTMNNLESGDVASLDGIFGTITLNGSDATVELRGIIKAVVDNLTGSPSVTTSGVLGTDLADVLSDTGTTGVALATGSIGSAQISTDAVNEIADGVLTRLMTESYPTDGSTMTPAQALYHLISLLSEFAISGTTITCKQLDGVTTASTHTLDDGTNPTSRTRAT